MLVTKSFVIKSFNRLEDTYCSKTTSVQHSIKYPALNNHKFSLKFLPNLPFHSITPLTEVKSSPYPTLCMIHQ